MIKPVKQNRTKEVGLQLHREKHERLRGYSIIEMMVVMFIFSILAVVATQSMALVLKGLTKSENIGEARANVEYAMSVIERTLRNADTIGATCGDTITYTNSLDGPGDFTFRCRDVDSDGLFEIDSSFYGQLTSNTADFLECAEVFTCPDEWTVDITLTARDPDDQAGLGAIASESARVILRARY